MGDVEVLAAGVEESVRAIDALSPAALELVEYSPRLDPTGRTARVAIELLRSALCGKLGGARQQPKVVA